MRKLSCKNAVDKKEDLVRLEINWELMPISVRYWPAYEGAVNDPIFNLVLVILAIVEVQAVDTLDLDVKVESYLVHNFIICILTAIGNTLKTKAKGSILLASG